MLSWGIFKEGGHYCVCEQDSGFESVCVHAFVHAYVCISVKPAPVDNIWAKEKNSTCVTLAWNHSRVYRDKFFRLSYTRAQEDSNMVRKWRIHFWVVAGRLK